MFGRIKVTTKLPTGIKKTDGYDIEKSKLRNPRIDPGADFDNTFDVQPRFDKVEGGVRFNVETVPIPKKEHQAKPQLSRQDLVNQLEEDAVKLYSSLLNKTVNSNEVGLEAVYKPKESLVGVGGNSFFVSILTAFAQHLPLTLSPDHIWTTISYAFAKHVELNAEKLRDKFVKHKGKQRLLVVTRPDFGKGDGKDPDTGAGSERWEAEIFPQFSNLIRKAIGDKPHSLITADFSTTESSERAASEVILMASMQKYFSFGMKTRCGIPDITLLGSHEDWVNLREKAESLGEYMTPTFTDTWLPLLLPVLDMFVESYQGNVNHGFWQSMVKIRSTGNGSGAYDFISGWIQILFPYLADGKVSRKLRPWNEMYFSGPKPTEIPAIVSTVPVDWDYFRTTFDLHFHGGFTGFSQDDRGGLKPNIGWFVGLDPPKPPGFELKQIQQEINDLWLGHENDYDYRKGIVDIEAPFFLRLKFLEIKEQNLLNKISPQEKTKAEGNIKGRKNTANFLNREEHV